MLEFIERVKAAAFARISPEMTVRLSLAFGTSAESWLNQQTQHDLWHAELGRRKLRVTRLAA